MEADPRYMRGPAVGAVDLWTRQRVRRIIAEAKSKVKPDKDSDVDR